MQIAGKPADKCPYCGCAMFVRKTMPQETSMTYRYERCRNKSCGRKFYTRQLPPPPREIVREVQDKSSSNGIDQLTVYRETA
jgi:hypothetical protein